LHFVSELSPWEKIAGLAETHLPSLSKATSTAWFAAAYVWPAPGSAATELGVLMEPEVCHGETEVYTEFKFEAVRLIKERGVSYAQASLDLGVHQSQLRGWVKALADDPQHAFPGQGQMKPEQLEIAQLKREVIRLKAERDILKKAAAYFAKEST
jgi:transposase